MYIIFGLKIINLKSIEGRLGGSFSLAALTDFQIWSSFPTDKFNFSGD